VDFDDGPAGAVLADNYEWQGNLQVIPFLRDIGKRDIGKHFSLWAMTAKEVRAVKDGAL
jgi:tyrosyl-tRNA synthetase